MIFEDFEDLDFVNKDDSVPSVVVPIPKVLTEDAVGEELIDLSLLRTLSFFETYDCPVCLDVISRPRFLPCGHIYCRVCILQIVEMTDHKAVRCSVCRAFSNVSDIRVFDLFARNMKESISLLKLLTDAQTKVTLFVVVLILLINFY